MQEEKVDAAKGTLARLRKNRKSMERGSIENNQRGLPMNSEDMPRHAIAKASPKSDIGLRQRAVVASRGQ